VKENAAESLVAYGAKVEVNSKAFLTEEGGVEGEGGVVTASPSKTEVIKRGMPPC